MPPELQNILNAQQEAMQHAQASLWQMYVFGYSTYAAILVCAVFSVLIFWKLCQIQKQLVGVRAVERPSAADPVRELASSAALRATTEVGPPEGDSRYMPKG